MSVKHRNSYALACDDRLGCLYDLTVLNELTVLLSLVSVGIADAYDVALTVLCLAIVEVDGDRLSDAGHTDVWQSVPFSLCAVIEDVGEACAVSECLEAYVLYSAWDEDYWEFGAACECCVTDNLQTFSQLHVSEVDASHECACRVYVKTRFLQRIAYLI